MSPDRGHWPYPAVIAHRGAGTLAPENTLAAMRRGLALGFAAVEFDVMLSRDEVPVVVHDVRLGRTVAGRGSVPDHSAADLLSLDAGGWFDAQHAGERMPTLVQVLEFCHAHGIWMNVEIKPAPGFEASTGAVVAAQIDAFFHTAGVRGAGAVAAPLLSSFSAEALTAARSVAPKLKRACLFERLPSDWLSQVRRVAAVAVHISHRHLTARLANDIGAAGLGLFCYTVNDPARARQLLEWGVDALCTDRPDLIGADFASRRGTAQTGGAAGP